MKLDTPIASSDSSSQLEVYLREYDLLKQEQTARIGFRDNLLYATLGVYGGIISFCLGNKELQGAMLVLPWASFILGWTYLINDEKISAIGRYMRHELAARITKLLPMSEDASYFGWEIAHRSDDRRCRRKCEQILTDQLTFVFSAYAVLWVVYHQEPAVFSSPWIATLAIIEASLITLLGWEILVHADLKRGK